MRSVKTFVFVALAALIATACGKGPAEAALTAADAAVSSTRSEGEKFVPEQFKALSAAAAAARSKFDSGDYRGALEAAQTVSTQAQSVMAKAAARKTATMETWKAMEGSLPTMVAGIQKKLMELATVRRLPDGLDKAGVESAKTDLEAATSTWADAGTAFSAGDLMTAVTKASEVKKAAEGLMGRLGMAPAVVATQSATAEPAGR